MGVTALFAALDDEAIDAMFETFDNEIQMTTQEAENPGTRAANFSWKYRQHHQGSHPLGVSTLNWRAIPRLKAPLTPAGQSGAGGLALIRPQRW